jgi:hypothetical protein
MRNVCNGVIWFTLISGSLFAVASQAERPDELSRPSESALGGVEGHPSGCLACKTRGRSLPPEIDDQTVWLERNGDATGLGGPTPRRPRVDDPVAAPGVGPR